MSDPFRDRRYDPAEVRAILRRAAEIAERDPDTAAAERSLTRQEIEGAAGELGLPASAVARALSPDEADAAAPNERSWFLGAPTRLTLEDEVVGEPSESDCEDLLEEIRSVMGETGTIERVGKTMIWKLTPGYRGRGRELSVRLRSRDGRTKIVVEERLGALATGLFVGLGVGGGVGPMGGYIVAIIKLGVAGGLFPLLWIPLMLLLARTIFVGMVSRRERELATLMRRMKKATERWSPASPAARVRVAAVSKRTREGEDDIAAEAEAEAEAAAADEPSPHRAGGT